MQTLFDSWAVSVYNIFFTGLPILMVAIFDKATSRQQILQYPKVYERGIRSKDVRRLVASLGSRLGLNVEPDPCGGVFLFPVQFSRWDFWGWQFLGIVQSIIIAFFGFASYMHSDVSHDGGVLDLFSMGATIMTSVIYVVSVKIALITKFVLTLPVAWLQPADCRHSPLASVLQYLDGLEPLRSVLQRVPLVCLLVDLRSHPAQLGMPPLPLPHPQYATLWCVSSLTVVVVVRLRWS